MKPEPNEELRTAWDFVEHTGRSIFLTGKAGTGKTTFLRTVVSRSSKRSVVVAPTGVAAINAGGSTIHSFFQLPFTPFIPSTTFKNKFDFSRDKRRIISSLDLLIIDEISMVRSDLLDAIDAVLRRYRDHYRPFGGVQLLMLGDLQQLTPVVTAEEEELLSPHYATPYFFSSKALAKTDYVTIQLTKVYRQQDLSFLDILNHIRTGEVTDEVLARLNTRYIPGFVAPMGQDYIRLTTHNWQADQHNESELARLTTPAFSYYATIEKTFPEFAYPTTQTLVLKKGTQVMFVKNDPSGEHLYYNGRIGHVTHADGQHIRVRCPGDANDIEVERLTWENTRYTLNEETHEIETEVLGTFTQFPLRLAWAITIHKSQGLTFDHAVIDANHSFAPGQVYVALSRCRTLEGMVLSSPIRPRSIINDTRVDDYIAHQEQNARESIARLAILKEEYYRQLLLDLFDFAPLLQLQQHLTRTFVEFFSRSFPQLEQLQKQTLQQLKEKVTTVASKWTATIMQMPTDQLHAEPFLQRVSRSATYFADTLHSIFEKPLRLTTGVETSNKQAKKRLESNYGDLSVWLTARRLLLLHIATEGFSMPVYLKQKQLTMLEAMDKTSPQSKRKTKSREPREPKEKTADITIRLFRQGLSIGQIATLRNLSPGTIYTHLMPLVKSGDISIDDIVSAEHLKAIRRIIGMVGTQLGMAPIKALCPPDVNYYEIQMVLNDVKSHG